MTSFITNNKIIIIINRTPLNVLNVSLKVKIILSYILVIDGE